MPQCFSIRKEKSPLFMKGFLKKSLKSSLCRYILLEGSPRSNLTNEPTNVNLLDVNGG